MFQCNLVEATSSSLKSKIKHARRLCQVQGTRNAYEFNASRQFIDGNERDYLTGSADEEISWPWFAFLLNVNCNWWHLDQCKR